MISSFTVRIRQRAGIRGRTASPHRVIGSQREGTLAEGKKRRVDFGSANTRLSDLMNGSLAISLQNLSILFNPSPLQRRSQNKFLKKICMCLSSWCIKFYTKMHIYFFSKKLHINENLVIIFFFAWGGCSHTHCSLCGLLGTRIEPT